MGGRQGTQRGGEEEESQWLNRVKASERGIMSSEEKSWQKSVGSGTWSGPRARSCHAIPANLEPDLTPNGRELFSEQKYIYRRALLSIHIALRSWLFLSDISAKQLPSSLGDVNIPMLKHMSRCR